MFESLDKDTYRLLICLFFSNELGDPYLNIILIERRQEQSLLIDPELDQSY